MACMSSRVSSGHQACWVHARWPIWKWKEVCSSSMVESVSAHRSLPQLGSVCLSWQNCAATTWDRRHLEPCLACGTFQGVGLTATVFTALWVLFLSQQSSRVTNHSCTCGRCAEVSPNRPNWTTSCWTYQSKCSPGLLLLASGMVVKSSALYSGTSPSAAWACRHSGKRHSSLCGLQNCVFCPWSACMLETTGVCVRLLTWHLFLWIGDAATDLFSFSKMCALTFSNSVTLHNIINNAIAFLCAVSQLWFWENIPFLRSLT